MAIPSNLADLLTVADLEQAAARCLLPMARDYYNGGALDGHSLRRNVNAYEKWEIWPRVLRDVSKIDMSVPSPFTSARTAFPLGVAPAAMQKMAHPEGEEAVAKVAGSRGWMMGLSSFSTTKLEDVKALHGSECGPNKAGCVLQMYLFEDRQTSLDLIRRAEGTITSPHSAMLTLLQPLDTVLSC